MFRIQKVLLHEFDEIYEPVLIENPCTLVDATGAGVRQYHIALTCTKVLFGCDNFDKHDELCGQPCWLDRGLDPEIECFDLVSMLPLQFIRFNFFRKQQRCLMIINIQQDDKLAEKPMIFEFGGHLYMQHFWHTWRQRVSSIRVMQPKFSHISYSSPFSSSDVQLEEQVHHAQVHQPPVQPKQRSVYTVCYNRAGCH